MGIEIDSLIKRYDGKVVLDGIELHINEPGVYLIAGPNGCGKTTLLEILVGLRKYDQGRVKINDQRVDDVELKRKLGFLTQQNTLRKNCTVAEELNLVKEIFKLDIDTYKYLERYKLQEYYHQKTKGLSGGTKRRVLIAMLFMTQYEVAVLDEPVSGLDTFSRDEIWNMIREYAEENIVVVSDHYLNQAALYSDYVYLMNKGKIVLHGKTTQLIKDFKRGYVIKTRVNHLEELNSILDEKRALLDLKVSGSVYNYFVNQEDQQTIQKLTNSSQRINVHPVNLEDIYFYYTGEFVKDSGD
ncbi:ABC transporter ATP-binding protein [Evansella sp. AB-rgal1]|uniref:ABC transporter ATP-binding protein n=1 Tax=Evansella sp. AB-rgal1 TaxID=3242696 RepID=UPI00359E4E2F